jgi:hypothetical protein
MLKEKGCLMFNTFYKPKSGLRKYKNSRTGTEGIERFQYFPDKRTIEHELEPHDQSHVIRHTILVYIIRFASPRGCQLAGKSA